MFAQKKIDDLNVNVTTTFEIEEDRDCFYTLVVQDDFVYIEYYEKENGKSVRKDEVIIPSQIASVIARLITQEINKINNDIEISYCTVENPYYTTISTSAWNNTGGEQDVQYINKTTSSSIKGGGEHNG